MLLVAALLLTTTVAQSASECATWQECRDQARQAEASQDYERFHDLAWRAVQKGRKNDPDLMSMLARAQSLSGRPGDALVMLQRLAALGVVTDAATSEAFQRVRALPAWPEAEAAIRETAGGAGPSTAPAAPTPKPARRRAGAAEEPKPSEKEPKEGNRGEAAPAAGAGEEALRFTSALFEPMGLAYDAVSDRFIVGDRRARKLTVVDEASHRVANLASAQSAGFGDIAGFEIDVREGDLWVATGTGTAGEQPATLHKLQLVSGRVLYALPVPASFGNARLSDVAVAPHGTIVLLDAEGRRLLKVAPRSRTIELAARLSIEGPASVAPESDEVAFVAHEQGIVRVELGSGSARALTAARGVDLRAFSRIRWHRGSLIGVQRAADGSWQIVRLRLDGNGRRVSDATILDRGVPMPDPTAIAISKEVLFYLATPPPAEGGSPETIVRRISLR